MRNLVGKWRQKLMIFTPIGLDCCNGASSSISSTSRGRGGRVGTRTNEKYIIYTCIIWYVHVHAQYTTLSEFVICFDAYGLNWLNNG